MAATILISPSGSWSTRRTSAPSTLDGRRREQLVDDVLHGRTPLAEVLAPGRTPIGQVDPLEEGRDDLAQLGQHEPGVVTGLGQRMGPHAQQQGLVALAAAVDAHVGQRGCRQDAPHGVERLGLDGLPVDEVGVGRVLRRLVPEELLHLRRQAGVGVEQAVEIADVPGAQRPGHDFGIPVVAVAPAQAGVVGDVAGRLLQVGHEPAPLEHLGEHVGCLLAGEVDASELGDRVVAVLEEDAVVEPLGPFEPDRRVDGLVAPDVELADELVEEQAAE